MIYITRRERFNAAHMLWNYNWNEQKNIEVFGKCANKNWHGHNFELFVTVKGEVNTDTGFVVNLKDLAKIIQEKLIDKLDHKNLNIDVDFMKDKMASTEVLAIAIWEELEANIMQLGATLHCIRVQETENNFVEYFGK